MTTLEHVLGLIAHIILTTSIIPLAIFAYRYWSHSPWRISPMGRALLKQKIVLFLIVLSPFFALFFGDSIIYRVAILLLYTAIVVLFWNDVFQLLQIQKHYPYDRRRRPRMTRPRKQKSRGA